MSKVLDRPVQAKRRACGPLPGAALPRLLALAVLLLLQGGFSLFPPAALRSAPSQESKRTRIMDITEVSEVERYFSQQEKTVLTFLGYSGTGYEDPERMLREASAVLEKYDPEKTIVNCGATAVGIGQVYELARRRGFATTGIVSSLAREYPDDLSPHVEKVFFVKDDSWGGFVENTRKLSPTSQAMVSCSDVLVAIGGGEVARDELTAARQAGKSVRFIPADMNHEKAIAKARKKNAEPPRDFRGAAHDVFGKP